MSEAAVISEGLTTRFRDNPYLPKLDWLRVLQEKQLNAFLQRGFPTRHEEQWKYTDTSLLTDQEKVWAQPILTEMLPQHFSQNQKSIRLVFVNGYFSQNLSDVSLLPADVLFCPLSQALDSHQTLMQSLLTELDAQQFPFASLNTALLTDGIILSLPKNTKIDVPVHCLYYNTQKNNFITCPRNIIILDENSQVVFLEEYVGHTANNYITNAVTTIHAKQNARIDYYKIQTETVQAMHFANVFVTQEKDSVVKSFNLAVGSHLARENVRAELQTPGAECHLNGFYKLIHHGQHIDNQLQINHVAEKGTSTMLFKGILDKKSRAVFNGKVYVHKNAQKINAQQANHNLLLSQEAEINTKPELEIYADDVKCTHGATVGQLDLESLFYLRARGIEKNHAMTLLTHAFAADVFNKIDNLAIRQHIESLGGEYAE